MKNRIQRLPALLLAMVMCLSLLSAYVWAAEETADVSAPVQSSEKLAPGEETPTEEEPSLTLQGDSGKCGDNLTWTLDDWGTLIISGQGKMKNNYYIYQSPWEAHKSKITSVVIKDGVTSVGAYMFCQCNNLRSVTIPNSVTSIGEGAFMECKTLLGITIPDGVTSIGVTAFAVCPKLWSVTIPSSVTSIGKGAFGYDMVDLNPDKWELNPNFIISGYNNSAAQTYAKENNIPFESLDDSHEHTWDEGVVTTSATCKSEGVKTFTCSVCGDTKSEAIPKDFNNHVGGTEVRDAKAATETVDGYTGDTYCNGCGAKLQDGAVIPKTGMVQPEPQTPESTSTLSATKGLKVTVKKTMATVTWKKNTTGKGYEVQYSAFKSFAKAKTVKINKNKTVKVTVKKLKKGTWFFRIRTVRGKKTSGWSKVKSVKVK